MAEKQKSVIERIHVDDATFHGVDVEPTYINFFFGNNGTGKSTIAKVFKKFPENITWTAGENPDNYTVHVYNQDFVAREFPSYGGLKGVFTLSKENAEIREKIEKKTEERKKIIDAGKAAAEKRDKKKAEMEPLLTNFQNLCFAKTDIIRKAFPDTQEKRKKKAAFANLVLERTYAPVEHDQAEIRKIYDIAFDQNARKYEEFKNSGSLSGKYDLSGSVLLGRSVTSSSDTDFARFMKALQATDWVKHGYAQYVAGHDEKRCPFCQQPLRETFEKELADCFDDDYQNDLSALDAYRDAYSSKMQQLVGIYRGNLTEVFPKVDVSAYEKTLLQLEAAVAENIRRIQDKINAPSKLVVLEETDGLVKELDSIIQEINKEIKANNDIVGDKPGMIEACTRMVWELIAFILEEDVEAYLTSKEKIDEAVKELDDKVKELQDDFRTVQGEINVLNSQAINMQQTVDSMNSHLRDSGFEGFYLREKQGVTGTYEVVRPDGEIAENLSEGERNFIAFLYFYHLVQGSQTQADVGKDKIVVIDDPVSSMDSGVLFIVSALVREMISICRNNVSGESIRDEKTEYDGSYIKQIFILTHNAFFHQEITYDMVQHYRYVTFFKVDKKNNISSVNPCIAKAAAVSEHDRNYNPVHNAYSALWEEYRAVDAAVPLVSVMRRILEFYFLQLCRYDSEMLTKKVLEAVKNSGAEEAEVTSKYNAAKAVLSYIRRSSSYNDGLYFVDESIDCDLYKEIFELIFEVMGQHQHYEMMMNG